MVQAIMQRYRNMKIHPIQAEYCVYHNSLIGTKSWTVTQRHNVEQVNITLDMLKQFTYQIHSMYIHTHTHTHTHTHRGNERTDGDIANVCTHTHTHTQTHTHTLNFCGRFSAGGRGWAKTTDGTWRCTHTAPCAARAAEDHAYTAAHAAPRRPGIHATLRECEYLWTSDRNPARAAWRLSSESSARISPPCSCSHCRIGEANS